MNYYKILMINKKLSKIIYDYAFFLKKLNLIKSE